MAKKAQNTKNTGTQPTAEEKLPSVRGKAKTSEKAPKTAEKPSQAGKAVAQAEPLKKAGTARTPEAEPSAVKKSGRKVAAKPVAEKAEKSSEVTSPAPRKAAAKKAAKGTGGRSAKAAAQEPEAQAAQAGSIKPTVKRPAYLPPINGNLVVRQQRRFMEGGRRAPSENNYDLPRHYDRTHLTALVRDSEWIYVFWEIAPRQREELGLGRPDFNGQLMLRLFDITGIEFDGTNAIGRTDIPVNDLTSSWYVHVPQTDRRYLIELGIAGPRGDFMAIARSNAVFMPSAKISDEIDWEWGSGDEESHLQILRLSGGADIPLHLSSADFVNELRRRFLEESAGFSGELFSGSLMGSDLSSQSVGAGRHQALTRDRGFWLVVDTEVIVYGATDPNARVKFMGREIKLNPDGTFGIRLALPDGKLEFPIEATSPDEYETRSVCPVVSRKTL